jgi:hypothetical protein
MVLLHNCGFWNTYTPKNNLILSWFDLHRKTVEKCHPSTPLPLPPPPPPHNVARPCPNFMASPARKLGQYLKKYDSFYSFKKGNFWKLNDFTILIIYFYFIFFISGMTEYQREGNPTSVFLPAVNFFSPVSALRHLGSVRYRWSQISPALPS